MPVEFEVVANNCELAGQILDAGIALNLAERAVMPDLQFTCLETAEPAPTAWQIILAIYVVALLPAILGWAVLYLKKAPTDRFFKWSIISMVFPLIGPIFALIPVDEDRNYFWA